MTTKLTRAEVLRAIADGKAVRNTNWIITDSDNDPASIYYQLGRFKDDSFWAELGADLTENEHGWELYEPPTQERLATTLEEALRAGLEEEIELTVFWPEWLNKIPTVYSPNKGIWDTFDIGQIYAALSLPGARVVIEA